MVDSNRNEESHCSGVEATERSKSLLEEVSWYSTAQPRYTIGERRVSASLVHKGESGVYAGLQHHGERGVSAGLVQQGREEFPQVRCTTGKEEFFAGLVRQGERGVSEDLA